MAGFTTDIEEQVAANEFFRRVIFTAPHMQLVLMALQPNEDIGMETHKENDQFLRIESGEGKIVMNGEEWEVRENFVIVVPAGTEHNLINTSPDKKLKLYTLYSPPHHKDGTVHKTKAEATAQK